MAEVQHNQSFGSLVGDMYARWTLDCLIEIAHAVSLDFVARPDRYHGSDIPERIADLRGSYGYQHDYPNQAQRTDLNSPVFGPSDGYPAKGSTAASDQFHNQRDSLFKACVTYTERSVVDPPEGLKASIIQAINLFAPRLRSFDGASLKLSHQELHFISELSYQILRSPVVSGRFGIIPAPAVGWPLETDDEQGALLIDAISTQLQLKDWGQTEEQFRNLRTMAQDGNEALEAILIKDPTGTDRFETLVKDVYAWAKSVEYYKGPALPAAR